MEKKKIVILFFGFQKNQRVKNSGAINFLMQNKEKEIKRFFGQEIGNSLKERKQKCLKKTKKINNPEQRKRINKKKQDEGENLGFPPLALSGDLKVNFIDHIFEVEVF